jgi:hypothetical protein
MRTLTALPVSLKNEEYIGENRCWPCTIANCVIGFVLGSVLTTMLILRTPVSVVQSLFIGVLFTSISYILIYARGYLIPKTPELTKKHLPQKILKIFGKSNNHKFNIEDPWHISVDTDSHNWNSDVDSVLTDIGALEECENKDDLCITDKFDRQWRRKLDDIEDNAVTGSKVARKIGFSSNSDYYIESKLMEDSTYHVLMTGDTVVAQWPSEAAIYADFTALMVLESWIDGWDELPPNTRGKLTHGLRLFLDDCPTSGGDTVIDEKKVESCCDSTRVITIECADTGELIIEQPV